MTEKEKMLSGKIYDPSDDVLVEERKKAHILCKKYNDTFEDETERRAEILDKLIPQHGENLCLQGPVQIDYGINTTFGDNCYANFNLTILDTCPVKIGNNVFIGPNVSFLTPLHPLCYQYRNMYVHSEKGCLTNMEYGAPITIGDNVWIAGNVTIIGGVTIGSGSVIGAGSVVTHSITENVVAFGNPCKVYRAITDEDRIELKKELF